MPSGRGAEVEPGIWIALTGSCALAMTLASNPLLFAAVIVAWGFSFWMGIPGVFSVLAERSRHPADRAGDAQAIMAGGRIFGPLLGALVLEGLGATALGVFGGGLMMSAGVVIIVIQSGLLSPRSLVRSGLGSPPAAG